MRVFTLPPVTIRAVVTGGVLVALFDAVPYERRINSVVVNCDSTSSVEFYKGIVSPAALIGTHPVGNKNTYMPPNRDIIPAGYPFYVRWPSATTGNASATAVFEGSY